MPRAKHGGLRLRPALAAFVVDTRAAAVELAAGAIVLLTTGLLAYDFYSRVGAATASTRMAIVMADYVSLDPAPSVGRMLALGQFLTKHELRVPADVVYVVTALHKPAGNPVEMLWGGPHRVPVPRDSGGAVPADLAGACPRFADGSTPPAPTLPSHFAMNEGEILIVVEVCARLTREGTLTGTLLAGDIYRFHALPGRTRGKTPAKPA